MKDGKRRWKILKDLKMTKDIFRPVKTHESQTKKRETTKKQWKSNTAVLTISFGLRACLCFLEHLLCRISPSLAVFFAVFRLTFILPCCFSSFWLIFARLWQAKDTKRHLLPIFWVTEWTGDVKTVYLSEPVTGLPKTVFYRLPKGQLRAG